MTEVELEKAFLIARTVGTVAPQTTEVEILRVVSEVGEVSVPTWYVADILRAFREGVAARR